MIADNARDTCKVRSAASYSTFNHIINRWDHRLKKNWTSLFVFASQHSTTFSISLALSLSVKLMLQLSPGPPARLSLQLVYPHRGFKICPFIWAAQAGKWKGCQSLEPWESVWAQPPVSKPRGGHQAGKHTAHSNRLFLSPSNVEKREENSLREALELKITCQYDLRGSP